MSSSTVAPDSLQALGLDKAPAIHRNDLAPALYEESIKRGTGRIGVGGALIVDTTPYTGRSPKDKFIVRDASTETHVAWGAVNTPFEPAKFDALFLRMKEHLATRELWIQDLRGGADPAQCLPIRLVSESPWHALFARCLFLRPSTEALKTFAPDWTILHAPGLLLDPAQLVKALVCTEGLPAIRLHTQGPDFYEQTFLLRRGDLAQKQTEAPQSFLQVLMRAPENETPKDTAETYVAPLAPPWVAIAGSTYDGAFKSTCAMSLDLIDG